MWTKEALHELVKEKLSDYLFIVVSNREPFIHTYSGKDIRCVVPASGLTAALDPVMRASGGIWVAHGSGDADKEVVDEFNKVNVPPEEPKYSLKRVWLTQEEEYGYYYGFSNQALWPLCHIAYTRPVFSEAHWNIYKSVNQKFAENVLDEVGNKKAFVFIQDYHLALLSRLIKNKNPEIITAQFWHIPWPNLEAFRICPWGGEILDGLLGNDVLGFHIQYHCNNFLNTVDRAIEARVDPERFAVIKGGKRTLIRPFPISVDFEEISRESQKENVNREVFYLTKKLGLQKKFIGVSADRIDYTKGIPERLKAIGLFLTKYPEYQENFVFIMAGVPSRTSIPVYMRLNEEIDSLIEEINWKYQVGHYKPVIYLNEHVSTLTLRALNRMANFCIVSSLHDGMNLVAKEFVSCRADEQGVLILSPFTGAARELTDALLVNPYATDHFAEAIKSALDMSTSEQQRRMRKLRTVVRENNIYQWASNVITELVKFEFGTC